MAFAFNDDRSRTEFQEYETIKIGYGLNDDGTEYIDCNNWFIKKYKNGKFELWASFYLAIEGEENLPMKNGIYRTLFGGVRLPDELEDADIIYNVITPVVSGSNYAPMVSIYDHKYGNLIPGCAVYDTGKMHYPSCRYEVYAIGKWKAGIL